MNKTSNNNFDIDLVYLWVDGNDSVWLNKRNEMLRIMNRPINELKGRYENNDELKYSLRSIEKYAPWVRNIFIVTDNQIPKWLDTNNPKVKIIDHKDILPEKALPCFNSVVIEYFIYKIPGLSEHFLYANDDMFINRNVKPSFFFKNDGYPIVRLLFKPFQWFENTFKNIFSSVKSNHKHSVDNATTIVGKRHNRKLQGITHHNIDAYKKSDFKNIIEVDYLNEINSMLNNHFRMPTDIQRILISLHIIAINHGHLKYVKRSESLRIRVHRQNFQNLIDKYNPVLFCLNDTEHSTDEDRAQIKPFLEKLFPDKSSYEK